MLIFTFIINISISTPLIMQAKGAKRLAVTDEAGAFVEEFPPLYGAISACIADGDPALLCLDEPSSSEGCSSDASDHEGTATTGAGSSGDSKNRRLSDCLTKLAHITSVKELQAKIQFRLHGWEIEELPSGEVRGKITQIQGVTFRCDCRRHGAPCKVYLRLNGRYEECECWLLRWIAYGVTCNKDAHIASGQQLTRDWRSLCTSNP